MCPSHRRARCGFTLVELLVVIAIISMLAGLLLPVLHKAIESARSIACINNEKQQYLGLSMYADNNLGYVPNGYYVSDIDFLSLGTYHDVLVHEGYISIPGKQPDWGPGAWRPVGSVGVFYCPSWRNYTLAPNHLNCKGYAPINGNWNYNKPNAWTIKLSHNTRANKPNAWMILTEGSLYRIQPQWPLGPWDAVMLRHSGQANYLFADGHIESHGLRYYTVGGENNIIP